MASQCSADCLWGLGRGGLNTAQECPVDTGDSYAYGRGSFLQGMASQTLFMTGCGAWGSGSGQRAGFAHGPQL